MSAKTTKVTLLATTVLLSALYQSYAFANELPTEPNTVVEVSDIKVETTDEVTSSEVVTNSSSTEESNGEVSSICKFLGVLVCFFVYVWYNEYQNIIARFSIV